MTGLKMEILTTSYYIVYDSIRTQKTNPEKDSRDFAKFKYLLFSFGFLFEEAVTPHLLSYNPDDISNLSLL